MAHRLRIKLSVFLGKQDDFPSLTHKADPCRTKTLLHNSRFCVSRRTSKNLNCVGLCSSESAPRLALLDFGQRKITKEN